MWCRHSRTGCRIIHLRPPTKSTWFHSIQTNRVINFTLVSQRAADVMFGRLTESVPFHQTSDADKHECVCVCACMDVCIRDGLEYICHLAMLPQTQRYPALCVESEPPDHGSRSLRVLNITKNKHTCSTKAQMLWGNTLIAVCGCQSNPQPSHSFLCSIFSFLFFNMSNGPTAPLGTDSWDQSENSSRCSLVVAWIDL